MGVSMCGEWKPGGLRESATDFCILVWGLRSAGVTEDTSKINCDKVGRAWNNCAGISQNNSWICGISEYISSRQIKFEFLSTQYSTENWQIGHFSMNQFKV
jgi:hypothetical protein